MPALLPDSTCNLEALPSTDGVTHGTRLSYQFPQCLSMDSRLRSGIAIFTLETLNPGLAA
jgi:hypothetical protein